ncbi:sigma-70 family RNA polymerase sigma factor [uncultured Tateyamaria sp.]|uniref:RNA polymerase sigma factor n=1 Tax=uncultured Tateyamaria sp. TaxID=455651 RepID=UPI002611D304|nr:sigma-70 family RNA polymerase sigma factor [uncultured Tateyamaria sp.]
MSNAYNLVALIPMLTRRARRLSHDRSEAEDLVQDTLLKLCQRLRRGRAVEDLPAYAMRTLQNEARKGWRRIGTEELQEDDALTQPDALVRLDCADTLAAIAALPQPQRRLLELVIAGETSPRAIALATGLPLGTVMSRLARARAKLRLVLAEE